MTSGWSAQRSSFVLALRVLTPSLLITTAISSGLAIYGAATQAVNASDRVDTRVWWLQAALITMSVVMVLRTIEVSPQLGRERADGQWVRRQAIGGANGVFASGLALLLLLEVGVALLTPIFELTVRGGRPGSVGERTAIEPLGFHRLDARHDRVEFQLPHENFAELELRPVLAAARMDPALQIRLRIEQDGALEPAATIDYGIDGTVLRIALLANTRRVALIRTAGDLALEFPFGTAHAIAPRAAARWIAGVGAASCIVVDWLPVIAALALARRTLSVGLLKFLAVAMHVALLVGGRSAQSTALAAHARDAWFWTARTQHIVLELLLASAVILSLTLVSTRRRVRRNARASRSPTQRPYDHSGSIS